ncbi:MAG: hypothetical protein ABEH78_07870 [Haloferacaceae archaeon]
MTGVSRRRLLALLGTGATAALAGCSRLFTRPDGEATPAATPSTPDTEEAATATETETPETATPTPPQAAVGTVVRIPRYDLSLTYRPVEDVTAADVRLDVRNVSGRRIDLLEIRVDMVYHPDDENRTVAVDYVGGRNFPVHGVETLGYETSYPNDGRANGSSDPDDFDLVFRVREVQFG